MKIAEEDRVLIIFECVSEGCCKVVSSKVARIPSDLVLEVRYVSTTAMPAYPLFLGFPVTIYRNFHTIVEHSITLVVVHDVELYTVALPSVLNSKVKPLRVTLGVNVILHQAVVFEVRYLLS